MRKSTRELSTMNINKMSAQDRIDFINNDIYIDIDNKTGKKEYSFFSDILGTWLEL